MIYSMTGFGRARREAEGLGLEVEIRSVNHRHLDLRVRLPRILADQESILKKRIQTGLSRGKVDVTVSLNEAGARTDWALIDLGIPPGFAVNAEDLTTLVEASKQLPPDADATTFERYELTGRQVLVYLGNLQQGSPYHFSYRLTAKFPLRAQTPASTAYDYYNPTTSGEAQPQEIVVVEE